MMHRRRFTSAALRAAVGLAALGTAADAWAQNLLVNPGFEAPLILPPAVNSECAGWTFTLDCQRAPFQQNHASHPDPTSEYGIWAKTFQPAGGGIFQVDLGNEPGWTAFVGGANGDGILAEL